MRRLFIFVQLLVVSTIALADVLTLSLGDIGQYSASLAATPTLTGSQVLFPDSASSNNGIDVVLSEELRSQIEQAVKENCNNIDTTCVDSVKNLLVNRNTEIQSRQVVAAGAALFALLALAIPLWEMDRSRGVPVALHIPSAQLGPAASAAAASTIVALIESGAPVTITPKPDLAATTGPNMPTQTTLSDTQDGHAPGDVAIYLSDDLASRINEVIARSHQCQPGTGSSGGPNANKAANQDTYDINAFICAAQSIILNSSPGAAFGELAMMPSKLPTWSSQDLAGAMGTIITFATTQAQFMNMQVSTAITLAYVAGYLAYGVIINKKPLGKVNWIAASELKGTVTGSPGPTIAPTPTIVITSISTSSTSTLECSASCDVIGNIRKCATWCPTPTPTNDSPIAAPSEYVVKTVAFNPWVIRHHGPPQIPINVPIGLCPPPPGNATEFPLGMFNNLYTKFCEQNENATETVIWNVNSRGEQIPSNSRRSWFGLRGTSGEDDKYKDYKFMLGRQVPVGGKPKCSTSCAHAYRQLSLQDMCKRGDDKSKIANTGYLDAGCASYFFTVEVPEVPEAKAEITCGNSNTPFSAPKHDNAAGGATSVESAIKQWCTENDGRSIYHTPGDDVVYGRWGITLLDVPGRSSFWPRARLHGFNKQGKIVKEQCINAYTESLEKCEYGTDRTHGFSVLVGSMNYSLELSGWTQEGNPPWSQKASFPPSEDQPRLAFQDKEKAGEPYGPECSGGGARSVHPVDLEKAIDFFCVDGGQLKEFGKNWDGMSRYPPQGQPRFYEQEPYKSYLRLGAEPLDRQGRERPYFDAESCKGYDFKMGRDDCRYALRKVFEKCNTRPDRFTGGEYKYRCVRYNVFGVNERDS